MKISLVGWQRATLVGVLMVCVNSVQAASERTCQVYARDAVAAADRARSLPCPLGDPVGRWSTKFDDHFNWCRTVRDSTLDNENVLRSKRIKACADNHAYCETYANGALSQIANLKAMNCVPAAAPVGRWSADFNGHYQWCRNAISRSSTVRGETQARDDGLKRCSRCESYAGGAVASVQKLVNLGCAGKMYGNRWSPEFEDHRAWCLRVKEGTQRAEDAERDKELLACKNGPASPPAMGSPAPARRCGIIAELKILSCKNEDGSTASHFETQGSPIGCGATKEEAESAAARQFEGRLGDEPGQCQYRADFATGPCDCTFPPGVISSPLSVATRSWSAFATDGRGKWGSAINQADMLRSSQLAMRSCGGQAAGCRVFATSTERCTAYAESRQGGYWYAAGGGRDKSSADANAVRFCQSGTAPAHSCKIAGTWCR